MSCYDIKLEVIVKIMTIKYMREYEIIYSQNTALIQLETMHIKC